MRQEDVKFIAVHCSATRPTQDIGKADIDRWHRKNGWLMIGYHFVIKRDGTIEKGRPLNMAGAHVEGYNGKSIGICMAGGIDKNGKPENNFTEDQFQALALLILELRAQGYDRADVRGHRDFPGVKKDCPCFDVREWMKANGLA